MAMPSGLVKRILSAGVLIPATCGIIIYGSWPFVLALFLLAGVSYYEWVSIARKTKFPALLSVAGLLYVAVTYVCCYKIRQHAPLELPFLFVFAVWASDTG